MRFLYVLILFMTACASPIPNRDPKGEDFPQVRGQSLEKEQVSLPEHFNKQITLVLLGYKQNSQFDIDRWLIGLDMRKVAVNLYEIPTVKGWFPSLIQSQIDEGMRRGIPEEIWRNVITVYEDADKIQSLTGNTNPNNARVLLIDEAGKIRYFYDRGFSVQALNAVIETLTELQS